MCQCRLIGHNKCIVWKRWTCGAEGMREISAFASQFLCKLKTALKKISLNKKKNLTRRGILRVVSPAWTSYRFKSERCWVNFYKTGMSVQITFIKRNFAIEGSIRWIWLALGHLLSWMIFYFKSFFAQYQVPERSWAYCWLISLLPWIFFSVIIAGFNSTWNSPFSDILTRNGLILIVNCQF